MIIKADNFVRRVASGRVAYSAYLGYCKTETEF